MLPIDLYMVQFPMPRPEAGEALFEWSAPAIAELLDCPTAPAELYVVEQERRFAAIPF